MITVAHKIEIKPNNKQKTYFGKAFGCARLAWNWGLAEWQRQYHDGGKPHGRKLRDRFNSIRAEQFPFTYEVSKYATARKFDDLQTAFERFFKHLGDYPVLKKKKRGYGSFYIGNDQVKISYQNGNSKSFKKMLHNVKQKHQYLRVPNLGWVRMTECVRFNGKLNGVTISQDNDKYFASFSFDITEEEYRRTHPNVGLMDRGDAGIDLGVKSAIILSDGISIDNPKFLYRKQRRIKILQRQSSKRVHAKTKQERRQHKPSSKNYRKKVVETKRVQRKVADCRRDFQHKVTTILTTYYKNIGMENLNTAGMMKNHHLAQAVADVAFGEIRRQITYKAQYNGVNISTADRFYPSSKTCSCCGNVVAELSLSQRTYRCGCCGMVIDRDLNAALNLRGIINHNSVGRGSPEFTPVDLTALLLALTRNQIATSKVESGRQHKL